jgi:hypothetical protein
MGPSQDPTMPTVTHPPETDAGGVTVTVADGAVARLGGAADGISRSPFGDLLPPGGSPARDPVPVPTRVLALDALQLLRRRRAEEPWVGPWSDPAFRAQVEVIRAQLAPIRSRRALADSFTREAYRMTGGAVPADIGPLRLAYALCWLELRR